MKSLFFALISAVCMLGCATQLSIEANQVRAMTEVDKPNCTYISDVEARGHDFDLSLDDAFYRGLNHVASVGGDSYVIRTYYPGHYWMQAWDCGWANSYIPKLGEKAVPPTRILAQDRQECTFIKSITESSNWGITRKRNLKNATKDAINRVQQAGGDSYYLVKEIMGPSTVVVVIEAWLCN